MSMDWAAWGDRAEKILQTSAPEGAFRTLFAPGATFSDPVNGPTTDIDSIEALTRAVYPDWHQEIVAVFGDDLGGAFEWIGRGTLGGTTPTVLHGATMLEIDERGLVTRWRDYFDLREIEATAPG
jgi:SnoaL-like domain